MPALCDEVEVQKAIEYTIRKIPTLKTSRGITRAQLQRYFEMDCATDDILDNAIRFMRNLLKPHEISGLKWILYSLSSAIGTSLLSGTLCDRPFAYLTISKRENIMKSWHSSPLITKSTLCRLFNLVSMFSALSICNKKQEFLWRLAGFPGIPDPKSIGNAFDFNFEFLSTKQNLSYDVVIVGSGAGGGVVAANLAKAGLRVLVCEKGDFIRSPNLCATEQESFERMCESKGFVKSKDGSINVIAGSVFGGGTTINWLASFIPPGHLREEWAKRFGAEHFLSKEFQECVDYVCSRSGVTTENVQHNRTNELLCEGSRRLGYSYATVPQNTRGKVHNCGSCSMGCPTATKQGTMETFLKDAREAGADFMCNAHVIRIERDHFNEIKGVSIKLIKENLSLFVTCKIVVTAAGSLHTPALLIRSGFKNFHIGRNLALHPVNVVTGYFAQEQVEPFEGDILTAACTEADNPDGTHYGAKIEALWSYPSLLCSILPYNPKSTNIDNDDDLSVYAGINSKMRLLKYTQTSAFIVLQRDQDSVGSISIDSNTGEPVVDFKLGRKDSESLKRGMQKAINIFNAVDATEIHPFIDNYPFYHSEGDFRKYCREFESNAFIDPPRNCALFSAHQMSSCRMANTPKEGACNLNGQLWECEDVWVADGSVMPTATGVNPMITIMSCAQYISQQLLKYIKQKN